MVKVNDGSKFTSEDHSYFLSRLSDLEVSGISSDLSKALICLSF